ncbi:type I-E CRISPR-associated protein Cse1/CasA [Corynebacterium lubricantis]|uniref:type I-E CRISPR-associated protein Cse1/CasA n=1 Tax=Corynebacterium lubricantis TaxID=541095 RepID=UPI00037B650B|nr:type I-E CRISPR-associated protein Cse1/CasA [Corynebacterium lubricantis]
MFSLITEPWIRGEDSQGETVNVSLKDVFDGTAGLVRLQGDSPVQDYSVLRVLLAIFWRAHVPESQVNPGETFQFSRWFETTWNKLEQVKSDRVSVEYLEKYSDRFNLLDTEAPFMQVADLHTKDGTHRKISQLIPEINSNYFTMRAGQGAGSVSFAEAARWLINLHAFDFSGIKTGVEGDSREKGGKSYPIGQGWSGLTGGTVIQGDSILQTLLLNTVAEAISNANDRPVWERLPDGPDVRSKNPLINGIESASSQPQGPADLATWQTRRVRLINDGHKVTGVLITNGDRIPDAGANVLGDPMTPYRFSSNKSKKDLDVYYPRPYDPQRTMWRSLDALIVSETDAGFSTKEKAPKRPGILTSIAEVSNDFEDIPDVLNLQLVSVEYGPQASSVASTISAEVGVPTAILLENQVDVRDAVRSAASSTGDAAIALGQFAGNLSTAAGGEYSFQAQHTDGLLAELEPGFLDWLRALPVTSDMNPDELESQIAKWEQTVRSATEDHAQILLKGAGPKAFIGRQVFQNADDTKGRLVSAGSVFNQLKSKLDQILPATQRKKTERQSATSKEKVGQ